MMVHPRTNIIFNCFFFYLQLIYFSISFQFTFLPYFFTITPTDATFLLEPSQMEGQEFSTPKMGFAPEYFQVDATLVFFNETWCERGCQGPDTSLLIEMKDEEVYLTQEFALFYGGFFSGKCFNCGYAQLSLWAHQVGASALLWSDMEVAGHDSRIIHSFNKNKLAAKLDFPALFIGSADAAWLADTMKEIDVDNGHLGLHDISSFFASTNVTSSSMNDDDNAVVRLSLRPTVNPWVEMWDSSWIVLQLVIGGSSLYVAGLSFQKCHAFITLGGKYSLYSMITGSSWWWCKRKKAGNKRRSGGFGTKNKSYLPEVCLTVEGIANLLRFFNVATDPLYCRGVMTYGWARFFLTITSPISWISTILIFLFWNDMIKLSNSLVNSMQQRQRKGAIFLSPKSKYVFLFSSIAVFALDLGFTMAMAFAGRIDLLMINASMVALVNLLMAGLFLANGRYITKYLLQTGNGGSTATGTAGNTEMTSASGAKPSETNMSRRVINHCSKTTCTSGGVRSFLQHGCSMSWLLTFLTTGSMHHKKLEKQLAAASCVTEGNNTFTNNNTATAAATGGTTYRSTMKRTNRKILTITRNIVGAGTCLIVSVIATTMAGLSVVLYTPYPRLANWLIIWGSYTLVSWFKIRVFAAPKRRVTSSNSSSATSSKARKESITGRVRRTMSSMSMFSSASSTSIQNKSQKTPGTSSSRRGTIDSTIIVHMTTNDDHPFSSRRKNSSNTKNNRSQDKRKVSTYSVSSSSSSRGRKASTASGISLSSTASREHRRQQAKMIVSPKQAQRDNHHSSKNVKKQPHFLPRPLTKLPSFTKTGLKGNDSSKHPASHNQPVVNIDETMLSQRKERLKKSTRRSKNDSSKSSSASKNKQDNYHKSRTKSQIIVHIDDTDFPSL